MFHRKPFHSLNRPCRRSATLPLSSTLLSKPLKFFPQKSLGQMVVYGSCAIIHFLWLFSVECKQIKFFSKLGRRSCIIFVLALSLMHPVKCTRKCTQFLSASYFSCYTPKTFGFEMNEMNMRRFSLKNFSLNPAIFIRAPN